ncbi:hypothetical protein EYC84_002626 [Monilinia fructicola]|nr:hypothetical protein EYC84_002626 [Monilinia fructicola]
MSSPKSTSTARSSMHMFSANVEEVAAADPHPFGNELAQVTEIAEEYGITKETLAVVDEEEQELLSRGLFKFRAEDYMSEIQGLFMTAFGDVKPTMGPLDATTLPLSMYILYNHPSLDEPSLRSLPIITYNLYITSL